MTRTRIVLGMCCLTFLAAGVAIGQQGGKDGMPAMDPAKMKEMMKKQWMEATEITPMHKFLAERVGTWDGQCTFWMDPSGEPDKSTCTTTITPMMGGMYFKDETVGTMNDFDKKPMRFEGFGLMGYNNGTKEFESTWCDNMASMQLHFKGKLSDDKKTLTLETGTYVCPMMGGETWMREVETITGPDSFTLEFYGPDMTGKSKEFKAGEIKYTRKGGMMKKMGR
jgi:hypothetical protein